VTWFPAMQPSGQLRVSLGSVVTVMWYVPLVTVALLAGRLSIPFFDGWHERSPLAWENGAYAYTVHGSLRTPV
jgi:hypothetical protein